MLRFIFGFLPIFMALFIAEGVSRLWIPSYGDALQRAWRLLECSKEFGWRQQPYFNGKFEGKEVVTDQLGFRNRVTPAGSEAILVIGPSSAFGWGVAQDEPYASVLENLLTQKSSEQLTKVVNAGEIGYSLVQGSKLYEQLRLDERFRSISTVIIAYGINDLDRFRFDGLAGRSDVEIDPFLPQPDFFDMLPKYLALWSLLSRAASELEFAVSCPPETVPKRRVSFEEFERKLEGLLTRIHDDGRRAVLLDTAFGYTNDDLERLASRSAALFEESVRASRFGQCSQARKLFLQAKSAEVDRIALDVRHLNQVIKEVAHRGGVPLVEVQQLLLDVDGPRNFVDPVHPSAIGHRKIAEKLLSTISIM